jgi:4-hydroxy-tetrahydrodipicolinate synthase
MTSPSWAGIFPSLATPFAPDDELDVDGQRAIVRFAVDHGSHGLICFGLAGEVFRLTPAERVRLLEAIVQECDHQVPVLAGVATEAEHTSVRLARELANAGADGLLIPPPLTAPPSESELVRYFEAVARATDLPVMIQDAPEFLNVEVGPGVIAELLERTPNLVALKLEVAADALVPWVQEFDGRLQVFCGNGGLYLIDCLRLGAAGIAPGVDTVDLLVEIHDLWRQDRHDDAWQRMCRVLPMLAFQMQTIEHYNATAKYVLQKRGVVECDRLRGPAQQLGPAGRQITDDYLAMLALVPA